MENIVIRNAEKRDLMSAAEIAVNGWKTAYRGIIADEYLDSLNVEEKYKKMLENYTEGGFIVAEKSDEIVGFCRYRTGNEYADMDEDIDCEICALYVKPECKRNGIGRKLVEYVKKEFIENKCKKMVIWCLKDNYPSRNFYEKMGGKLFHENIIIRGDKEYTEVGFIYDLKHQTDELELVFPTPEYKEKVEEYLQEFIDNGEDEIAGDGSLDRIKDFDEWLKKIQADLNDNGDNSEKVPATVYLTVRKSDNRIVGNVQIRHRLNEKLLNFGGHIGDSIRPSERKKGYATEQIRLALEKCKELGIGNVLMDCDKTNVGSRKSILNNGGVLTSEIKMENETLQNFWIRLKKRPVTIPMKMKEVAEGNYEIRKFETEEFKGDVALITFKKMNMPYVVKGTNFCMANDNYKWLEFYDYSQKHKLTAMYDDKDEIVEWYFDISREIGKENGLPYEDDLYLDVVIRPNGEAVLLDEDEIEEAYKKLEITKVEYDMAYSEANKIIEKWKGKAKELKELTDKTLKCFMER